ncbi:centrosomal protein of 95 kDa isoform X10 [Pan troglodytes]|uniref:centrosomal protein of 95 kDa isoform X10 n=1 Tax=Pan troglodytes TaxID=9598 RepID=UPI0030135842
MAGSDAEWVTIANNLLFKCHIHLRIHELQDCDANVFIALYQSILGEKVPDLIVIPRSQEDDAHNVQAVIDSLALDYLQVSLSHITGENIVKGDKESIKNLLEIFDGLLEYLTERISETSHEKTETLSVSGIPNARKLGEPIRAAIPLHPPYHPSESRAPCPIGKEYLHSSHCSPAVNSTGEHTEFSGDLDDGVFLISKLPKDSKWEVYPAQVQGPRTRKPPKGRRNENRATASSCNSPFPQRPRKRLTEQELHDVSEKLSQRLSELDWMLKSALGDRIKEKTDHKEENTGNEEVEDGTEETLSQHSDGIVEYGPKKSRPGLSMRRKPPYRSHSLSPSPVNKHKQFHVERKRQRKPRETDIRQFRAQAFTEAFERELRRHKVQENIGPLRIHEKEEETEKIYRGEAVCKGTPECSQPWKIYSRKTTTQSLRGGLPKPNKAVPMKVSEHSLLPLMLEQFPFLYVSGPTLSKMWKQQIAQVEQLKKEACRESRSKKKLQDEIEEALRRHDLLTTLVKKEYEHNKRLQDFKDCIRRQRLTQSKIKENRQQIVRARKYYDDYRVQLCAKMMRMRTREEMIFKKLFEEGLNIQKQRLRDLRNYAKEKRDEQRRRHQDELDSMENYYKDQFSLLAEAISQEHQELKAREKSQAQVIIKIEAKSCTAWQCFFQQGTSYIGGWSNRLYHIAPVCSGLYSLGLCKYTDILHNNKII